jgi:hypothetical protein
MGKSSVEVAVHRSSKIHAWRFALDPRAIATGREAPILLLANLHTTFL